MSPPSSSPRAAASPRVAGATTTICTRSFCLLRLVWLMLVNWWLTNILSVHSVTHLLDAQTGKRQRFWTFESPRCASVWISKCPTVGSKANTLMSWWAVGVRFWIQLFRVSCISCIQTLTKYCTKMYEIASRKERPSFSSERSIAIADSFCPGQFCLSKCLTQPIHYPCEILAKFSFWNAEMP